MMRRYVNGKHVGALYGVGILLVLHSIKHNDSTIATIAAIVLLTGFTYDVIIQFNYME